LGAGGREFESHRPDYQNQAPAMGLFLFPTMTTTLSDQHSITPHAKRALIAGMVGNVLEWYDFGIYGYVATIIAQQFFPQGDSLAALLATYGVFAAGFIMRPVGGVLFGYFGDKYGRKNALILSIILMAVPTVSMGLLPTYEQIGLFAPALLTLMRLLQGLSLGGEYTGSVSYLVEHAPPSKRGLFGSWATFAGIGGILLGSAVGALLTNTLSKQEIIEWGWRLPFLGGIFIAAIGGYMRRGLHESEMFKNLKIEGKVTQNPLTEALTTYRTSLLKSVGITATLTATFYIGFMHIYLFMNTKIGMALNEALIGNTIGMCILVALIPVAGIISDHVGRKKVLYFGAGGIFLFAVPLFYVLQSGNLTDMIIVITAFALFEAALLGAVATTLVELFPAKIRFTAVSLGYNLAIALFGGSAPFYSELLIDTTGSFLMPALYLILCSALTLFTLRTIPETYRHPLP
jgi:MHS family proline/betaine transporter-like MFS transporter